MKRPSFQFYPGDWLRSTDLRSCSIGARGAWVDMLCLMHEGNPYGYLKVGQKVILPPILACMVGVSLQELEGYLAELMEAGVCSIDEHGCIFSRRMIRDEDIRQKRAAGGIASQNNPNVPKKKGNPTRIPLDTSFGVSPASASASASSSSSSLKQSQEQSQNHGATRSDSYPESFELAWDKYPKRPGANKKTAFKAWNARIKAGVAHEKILAGVIRYSNFCEVGTIDPNYIKQAQTFFGPDEHYLLSWDPQKPKNQSSKSQRDQQARDWLDAATGRKPAERDITNECSTITLGDEIN